MWNRNFGYSVCEGGTAGLESKARVWKRNCRTSSRSTFLVWKLNYGTSKHYSLCGRGIADIKVTQYSMCVRGTAELKVSVYSLRRGGTAAPRNLRQRILIFCVWKQNLVPAWFLMWERNCGTTSHRTFYVRKRTFKSQNILHVGLDYIWFLMQWFERNRGAQGRIPWVKAILVVLLSSSNKQIQWIYVPRLICF